MPPMHGSGRNRRGGKPCHAWARWLSAPMPAYTPTGGAVPPQTQLDLPGYPGGNDIVGNRVRDQFQLDVFGEALMLFAAAARYERLSREHQRAVDVAVAAIEQNLRRPDSGI